MLLSEISLSSPPRRQTWPGPRQGSQELSSGIMPALFGPSSVCLGLFGMLGSGGQQIVGPLLCGQPFLSKVLTLLHLGAGQRTEILTIRKWYIPRS